MTSPRADDDRPLPLRVPTSPQRERIHDHAAALLRYLEAGGGVRFHEARQHPQLTVALCGCRTRPVGGFLRLSERERVEPPRLRRTARYTFAIITLAIPSARSVG